VPPTPVQLPAVPELASTAPDIWRPSTAAGSQTSGVSGVGGKTSKAATSLGTRSKSATHLSSSLRSGASAQKLHEQKRMQILKAVRKEEEAALSELQTKNQVRSSLADYFDFKSGIKDRQRQKLQDMPMHLRPGIDPVNMGCPISYETQTARTLNLPIKMAVDPKWSNDLKKDEVRIGQRLTCNSKLSAACTGSIAPELPHMWRKDYLSNPPTPYFVPGKGKEDY